MSFRRLLSADGNHAVAAIWLLPFLSALAGLAAFVPAGMSAVGPITFLLITLNTVLLSTFLLRFEWHERPPMAHAPGAVAPSLSPLSYFTSFTGNLMILLLVGLIDPRSELLLAWLNVLVVPYVLFAVFYQRRPVRQWCVMYLSLPVVLAGAPLTGADAPEALKIIVLLVLPFLAARLQVRTYGKNQENLPQPGRS